MILHILAGLSRILEITGYADTAGYMEQHGVTGVLLPLVILTELGGGLCVLTGFLTRYTAIALAGFCVLTAWLFHYQPGDEGEMIDFMKDISIAGGVFPPAAAGPGALALDNRR